MKSVADLPDKILEEPRLWRFSAIVMAHLSPDTVFQWMNPVPVYGDGKLVGHASLYSNKHKLLGDFVVEYQLPERLEVEIGNRVWTLPTVNIYLGIPKLVIIKGIELRTDCIDPDQEHIGEGIL